VNIGEKIEFYQTLRTSLKEFIVLQKERDPKDYEYIEKAENIISYINNLKIGDL
jgi:hypothetical protein